ncbi:HK97 gp10 family phage protein [Cedecea colo]|uniref:HK97 gp10 family phage protein n=1 Tax=Cedecea colo TaxID=2552946 RepID=A0ABX0VJY5_9ENTR|nr:HK97 gp10 family phage protein [Cedecea colo]NIY47267.1 HK97 gp10 family phage protein [Cedecea colo]
MGAKVKGISQVVRNLNKIIDDIQGKKAARATYMSLSVVGADAAAITPVDTSTLINSQFKNMETSSSGIVGTLGYTAEYAKAVHNASGKLKGQPRADFGMTSNRSSVGPQKPKAFGGGTGQGNYWDPHGEPQFLVKALEKNKDTIKDIYKKELKP